MRQGIDPIGNRLTRARLPPDFWYDRPQHEWGVLPTGAATVRSEDGTVKMRPCDRITIRPDSHRVEWTILDEPTVFSESERRSNAS